MPEVQQAVCLESQYDKTPSESHQSVQNHWIHTSQGEILAEMAAYDGLTLTSYCQLTSLALIVTNNHQIMH